MAPSAKAFLRQTPGQRWRAWWRIVLCTVGLTPLLALGMGKKVARGQGVSVRLVPPPGEGMLRIATFNVSLHREKEGELTADLEQGDDQAERIAALVRNVQPDILVVNELDYAADGANVGLWERRYLAKDNLDLLGSASWPMPHHFSAEVNTGQPSGLDLDRDGKKGEPEDAWGYGRFPGQYGMAVLSRFPIDDAHVRTFRKLKWSSMPHALRPRDPQTGQWYYADAVWQALYLPSKSFWDVPVATPQGIVHVLASHPTPPAFDGPEDRNGCRNHDEIQLLIDYLDDAAWIVDDEGRAGGLPPDALFFVAGDLNCDPLDGESRHEVVERLLAHRRLRQGPAPRSRGGEMAAAQQGGVNSQHRGDPAADTADFNDRSVGNLRVDYVLPCRTMQVVRSGVVWPAADEVPHEVRGSVARAMQATDHRLVWVDVQIRE
ncbi:MAG: endonuclease [Pirellulaceae bacterium]|nr:MAG: endonuclease [Pirellulaceae bacterium]